MNQTYNAEALRFVRCARRVNYFQRTRALVCDDYWQFVIVYKRITGEYPAMYVNEKPDRCDEVDRLGVTTCEDQLTNAVSDASGVVVERPFDFIWLNYAELADVKLTLKQIKKYYMMDRVLVCVTVKLKNQQQTIPALLEVKRALGREFRLRVEQYEARGSLYLYLECSR